MERLSGYKNWMLRHVILTYRWIDSDFERSADWLLVQARKLLGRVGWLGAVMSVEFKEKQGDYWYIHIHALSVAKRYDYGETQKVWSKLTGMESRFVIFKKIWSRSGLLDYVSGYALKGLERVRDNAERYVTLMKALNRVRLVRAFGCLYGGRKSTIGKTNGVQVSLFGEKSSEARRLLVTESSTKSVGSSVLSAAVQSLSGSRSRSNRLEACFRVELRWSRCQGRRRSCRE